MHSSKQIFETKDPSRWARIKWGSRILIALFCFALIVLLITLKSISTSESKIPFESKVLKKVLADSFPSTKAMSLKAGNIKSMKNAGFVGYINKQNQKNKQNQSVTEKEKPFEKKDTASVRAAYYMPWDLQSFLSLKKNISKLDIVLPEWLLIDPKADTLLVRIEKRDYDVIKASHTKIIPVLAMDINGVDNGKAFERVIASDKKRKRLIDDIVKYSKKFKFSGINFNPESIKDKGGSLRKFEKSLSVALRKESLAPTVTLSVFDTNIDFTTIRDNNDLVFLNVYDEHDEYSEPGAICSQKWVEATIEKFIGKIPVNKLILNLAAYGYDWSSTIDVKTQLLSYQQTLVTARESEATIDFDNDSYNLHFKYYDENEKIHEVHFTDAATNFNCMRFATEIGLKGVSLWRLGTEDSRLWTFFDKSLEGDSLKRFDFSVFNTVESSNAVDYIGEGEILDVQASPTNGVIVTELDKESMLISEEFYKVLPSTYVVKKFGKTSKPRLILTYDDGPDPVYTKQILDTLDFYKVPATFFIIGMEAENNIPLIKRILKEGHELGNHTFTHPDISKVSRERALLEMDATQLLIQSLTGRSMVMFRAPFNADSEPEKNEELLPVALSRTRNYITIGESLDPEDWLYGEMKNYNADTIVSRIVKEYDEKVSKGDSTNIILLHDGGGDRSQTVLATGKLIRLFRQRGFEFITVADLIGKKRDDLMPYVDNKDWLKLKFNYMWAETVYLISHLFFALFLVFIAFGTVRLLTLGFLAFLQRKKEMLVKDGIKPAHYPKVSIVVPAFNEEVNIVSSLENLLRCDYPNFNIVFVNDGSKDRTWEKAVETFAVDPVMTLLNKPNGGKASALNLGIEHTDAEYVVCIDADTKLKPDAVGKLMDHFLWQARDGKPIGAVAGVVKVGNEVNMLTRWQNIEYITSQNFDRKAFAYTNSITVVPGAIGAFLKKAIGEAGGFTTDTLAEDCDLTIRILREGYIVANEPNAIAMTEAPEKLKDFMKQRFRWSFGVLQTFWKHNDLLFSKQVAPLGWIALPDILIFKYIIPFFSPIADVIMLFSIFSENAGKVLFYYTLFTFIDTSIAAYSFRMEKESLFKLVWLIPQRIIYRWLMTVILYRSLRKALKGELQYWGVLKRTGNVKGVER